MKLAYYHISAHIGDEFLERNPTFERVNYVRDAAVLPAILKAFDDKNPLAANWLRAGDEAIPRLLLALG